jgi:hypothetical protein
MTFNQTSWKPGVKPEGAGRPQGSRNNRTKEVIQQIVAAGHKDPLLTLAELQAKSKDETIRAQAANMLAPYLHSKCSALPPLRYLNIPISCPEFTSPQVAKDWLATLPVRVARGELDLDAAKELAQLTIAWLNSQLDTDKLRLQELTSGLTQHETKIIIHRPPRVRTGR